MRSVLLLAALLLGLSGCDDLFSVSSLGKVLVTVGDVDAGTAMPGVVVTLNLRNSAGGEFQVSQTTGSGGETTFEIQVTGRLSASVTPPAGYVEGPGGLTRELIVNRGETVPIVFLLQQQ